ncbi:hypothetical protein U9M48_002890 [Paspalum notatum var. saurae]|uniref:Uncharacterized protein n=1 Tax=Paspalum notatum var. saurae TaxID=547442 RepID=A0AAQ3PHV5_PASNO
MATLGSPRAGALFGTCCKRSAAVTNNRGDKGSPCLTPLLRMEDTAVDEDISSGKPVALIIEIIQECSTVSNAFAKSSLRIIISLLES